MIYYTDMCVVIICGGRFNHITQDDRLYLAKLKDEIPISFVLAGGASGIDTEAITWAKEQSIEYHIENAKWEDISNPDAIIKFRKDGTKYDLRAGFRRNMKMAEMADACIALKGGTGTKHMLLHAKTIGLKIYSNYFNV